MNCGTAGNGGNERNGRDGTNSGVAMKDGKTKEKKPLGEKIQTVKKVAKVAKTGKAFYDKVLPWILVGLAAVAYAVLDVQIPEKKVPEKYKATW